MDDLSIALAAIKNTSKGWYIYRYAGNNPKTIAYREPNDRALWYMTVRSWDFAKIAGCSNSSARMRLSKLALSGLLSERPRNSGVRSWSASKPDAMRIGYEIIAELRAEGIPFDDEWRSAGKPSTWAPLAQTKDHGSVCNGPRGECQISPKQGIAEPMYVTTFSIVKTKKFFQIDLEPQEVASTLETYSDLPTAVRAGFFPPASASGTDVVAVDMKADGSAVIVVVTNSTVTSESSIEGSR